MVVAGCCLCLGWNSGFGSVFLCTLLHCWHPAVFAHLCHGVGPLYAAALLSAMESCFFSPGPRLTVGQAFSHGAASQPLSTCCPVLLSVNSAPVWSKPCVWLSAVSRSERLLLSSVPVCPWPHLVKTNGRSSGA